VAEADLKSYEARQSEWKERLRSDPRSTAELLRESPFDREAATILMARADREALDGAIDLCRSPVPNEREAGAFILGEIGLGEPAFLEETVAELCRLLREEPPLAVLSGALYALGHRDSAAATADVLPHTRHASEEIRYAATFALLTQDSPEAVAAMLKLSEDEDDEIRNWATGGLGSQIDVDTPEIRSALRARLGELDDEIRGEALLGLARRGDRDVIEPLIRELSLDEVTRLALEAADEMGDQRLLPYLEAIDEWWDGERSALDQALERCRDNPCVPRER
jgi:HEAT repeat protein